MRRHEFPPSFVVFLLEGSRLAVDARRDVVHRQAGHCILQPVSSTDPAAFSPGTGLFTVNMLSGSPCGGGAPPPNTGAIRSRSPAPYSRAPGRTAISRRRL